MKNTTLIIIGGIFALLLVGLFFTMLDNPVPFVEQVRNPEASAQSITTDQGAQLAVLSLVVLLAIGGMATTLYAGFWFLNREVAHATQQPEQPFELLSMNPKASNTTGALLANNALYIVIGLGGLMLVAALAVLFAL